MMGVTDGNLQALLKSKHWSSNVQQTTYHQLGQRDTEKLACKKKKNKISNVK
jgi:hypothetical protein